MRKIYLVLLLSFTLFGATGFLINGDSVVTITLGDSMFIQGTLEIGDTLGSVIAYIDLDNNGVADPNDPVIGYYYLIDGGWEDIDETINTFISTTVESFPVSGNFIYTVTDGVGSDQVILHVQPLSSSLSISGQIIAPDTAGVIVMTGPLPMDDEFEPIGAVTDSNGNYSINVHDSLSGRYFKIITMVFSDVLPDYLGTLSEDSVLVTGNETLNDSLIPIDGAALSGTFVDEYGSLYTSPIGAQAMGYFTNGFNTPHHCTKSGFATGGSGELLLHTSPAGQDSNAWTLEFTQESDPYYMTPKTDDTARFNYPPDTLPDTFTVFSCDSVIAGTVFVDGSVADGVELWANSDSTGSAPTNGTYSTGYYRILVSSHATHYFVGLSDYDWSLYGGDKTVPPGSTGVNFYVITSGIEEKKVPSILKISPNIITASVVLEVSGVTNEDAELKIYDVTGKLVETISQESLRGAIARYALDTKNLTTGIFFGEIEGQEGTLKLSVIK